MSALCPLARKFIEIPDSDEGEPTRLANRINSGRSDGTAKASKTL
jgi:hypothetical protein